MEVALNVSPWRARFGPCAMLATMTAVYLALPGQAVAASGATGSTTCIGHTQLAHADDPEDHPVQFVFACPDKITGYSIITSQEVAGFDTDTLVFDAHNAIIPDDKFACEGHIPGNIFSCSGTYGGEYRVSRGFFSINQRVCHEARIETQLLVYYSKNTTGENGQQFIAGPFDLGRPRGCPKPKVHKKTKAKSRKRGKPSAKLHASKV
jgi:hypothetical protein